jgi:hypothetical protein
VCVAVFVPASNETQGQRKNNETALECIPAVKGISREPEAKLCDSLLSSGGGGGQRLIMKHTGQLVKVDRAVDTAEGGHCGGWILLSGWRSNRYPGPEDIRKLWRHGHLRGGESALK